MALSSGSIFSILFPTSYNYLYTFWDHCVALIAILKLYLLRSLELIKKSFHFFHQFFSINQQQWSCSPSIVSAPITRHAYIHSFPYAFIQHTYMKSPIVGWALSYCSKYAGDLESQLSSHQDKERLNSFDLLIIKQGYIAGALLDL